MRIVFLGAPGSGKGTQAKHLMDEFRMVQISTGDLLRGAVAAGTELGKKAQAAMDAGDLVSDDIVLGILRDRLGEGDTGHGFILDGFPRNLAQAEALDGVLAEVGQPLDAVVLLDVDPDVLMKRLTGRRTCSVTGAGGELLHRADDNEETISNRLRVYREQTEPLVARYRDMRLLQTVSGEGEIDAVYQRLRQALQL
jgi:adenylate kinase